MRRWLLLVLVLAGCASVKVPDQAELQRLQAATPPGMVLVPGGEFLTGSNDPDAEEAVGPLRKATVASFYIDRTEVTNAQVRAVWAEHQFPDGQEEYPATGMPRERVVELLASLGKRLPTGLEWEKAARGTDGRSYPWGSEYRPELANVGRVQHRPEACALDPHLKAVESYPGGASPYGALDMIGNAWEWVSDVDSQGYHVIRGGAFGYPARDNRVYSFALEQPGIT